MEDDLADTKNRLEKETLLRQTAQSQLKEVEYSLKVANDAIESLKEKVDYYRSAAQTCASSLNKCKDSLASCQATP